MSQLALKLKCWKWRRRFEKRCARGAPGRSLHELRPTFIVLYLSSLPLFNENEVRFLCLEIRQFYGMKRT
jgi:hypothetical protein